MAKMVRVGPLLSDHITFYNSIQIIPLTVSSPKITKIIVIIVVIIIIIIIIIIINIKLL